MDFGTRRRSALQAGSDSGPLPFAITLERNRPVTDQIYDALAAAIVSIKLPPGASISENRICRHFGVSRTPVRAAIVRLVEDELIDVFPQLGSFVAPISLNTIKQSHFVRKALELAVLRALAQGWAPEKSTQARALIEKQRDALVGDDTERFHAEDEAFHRNLAFSAGLGGVWDTIQTAKARVDRVHRLAAIEGRLPVVIVEHEAVIDALDAGKAEEAAARLEYHLDRILDLLTILRSRNAAYFVD